MISLSKLSDIWVPAPSGLWPVSPTGWLLIGCVIGILAFWFWRYARYRRANRYRAQALHELRQAKSNDDMALVLKRTALVAYPRQQVASLSSERWCDWLASHVKMSDIVRRALLDTFYRPQNVGSSAELRKYCERWVQKHQGET